MALSSHADDVMMPSINLQLTRGRHYSPITTKCITMSLKQQHNICQSNGEMVFATKIQGTKRTQSMKHHLHDNTLYSDH